MKPKAYLQDLDTVRFVPEQHLGEYQGLLDEAYLRTMLYSVFYRVILSPNQVLDLELLRSGRFEIAKYKSWPFMITVDSDLVEKPRPFTNQFVRFLRRPEKDAFIFSSVRAGIPVAHRWADFLRSQGKKISNGDLLREIPKQYQPIFEFARALDKNANNLPPEAFVAGPDYSELFGDYLKSVHQEYLTPPNTRSEAYQKIDQQAVDEDLKTRRKQIPDLISNVRYAIRTQSRLVAATNSPAEFETVVHETAKGKLDIGSVDVDFGGLLREFPFLEDAILNSNQDQISNALRKSRRKIEEGWSLLPQDVSEAKKRLDEGLTIFLERILGSELPKDAIPDLGFKVSVRTIPNFLYELGFEIPIVKLMNFEKWRKRWKLKGLDKFTNIDTGKGVTQAGKKPKD